MKYKMKKNLSLYLAALVSCLLSCSDQVDIHKKLDDVRISLGSVRIDASLQSRSPLAGRPAVSSPFTALVPAAVTVSDANSGGAHLGYVDGLHALGTMTFSGGSAPVYYDVASLGDAADVKSAFPSGDQVYLFGLYPADASRWTLTNSTAGTIFTGKDDVMAAPEVLVKRADVTSGNYQELVFRHLLTRLEVKLKAKTVDAISLVGAIKSIRLVADASGSGKIKDRLTFTPGDGAAVFTESGTLSTLPFYQATATEGVQTYTDIPYIDQSYTLTTSAVLQAYSLVLCLA